MLDFTQNAQATEKNYTAEIINEPQAITVPAGRMMILIDLSKNEYPLTTSGKSLSIASSHGFDLLTGTTLNLSLNVTSKLPS